MTMRSWSACTIIQVKLDAADAWNLNNRVETTLDRLNLAQGCADGHAVGRDAKARRAGRARWSVRRTCCCWTSRPTISTSRRSCGWKDCCAITRAACCSSPMTARFLDNVATRIVELDRGRLLSFPGNFSDVPDAQGRAAGNRSESKTPSSTNSSRRKKCGYARACRRAARATKGGCGAWKHCACSAARGATSRDRSSSMCRPASAPARSSPNWTTSPSATASKVIVRDFSAHDSARRQGRPDRPERRRQDHAAETDPWRRAAGRRHGQAGHASCRSPISTRCARS